MTDPDVGRKTFEAVLHRQPERKEFTRLLERRLFYLHQTVAESDSYRVLAGVKELLPKLIEDGYLLGLVTGNLEAAAHIKLHRARINRFFSFGGYGSDSTDHGELTRIALKRAALVYGESVTPERAIVVGDTPPRRRGRARGGDEVRGRRKPPLRRRPAPRFGRRLRDRLARGGAAAMTASEQQRLYGRTIRHDDDRSETPATGRSRNSGSPGRAALAAICTNACSIPVLLKMIPAGRIKLAICGEIREF